MEAASAMNSQPTSWLQETGLKPSSKQSGSAGLWCTADQPLQAADDHGTMPANLHGSSELTSNGSGAVAIDGGHDDLAIRHYGSVPPSLAWQSQTEHMQGMQMVGQQANLDSRAPSMQSLEWQNQSEQMQDMQIQAQQAVSHHRAPSMHSLALQSQPAQMQNTQNEALQALSKQQAPGMQSLAWQAGPEQGRDLPSVHWEAVQVESVNSPKSDVAWAEYCSDSDESVDYQGPEFVAETVQTAVRQSSKEWSAASNVGAY